MFEVYNFDGVEISGDWVLLRAPSTHRMSGFRDTMHVHEVREHMHCSIYSQHCYILGLPINQIFGVY